MLPITFGSTVEECLGPSRTHAASGVPAGLRLNTNIGTASGRVTSETAADTPAADEGSPGRDEDVKPDLLIDPPEQDPDNPQEPSGSTDR